MKRFKLYLALPSPMCSSVVGSARKARALEDSRCLLLLLAVIALGQFHAKAQTEVRQSPRHILQTGWSMQSSTRVSERAELVSATGFGARGWYATSVPTTVLAALVENKIYPDPYFGLNLKLIPGTVLAEDFPNLPMPPESPFRVPWWFRTEFQVPTDYREKQVWLNFEGINYRANIWMNGRQIADSKSVAGPFRAYKFNITRAVTLEAMNTLAVEVYPEQPDDLGLNWMNLSPEPPDKNLGIWQSVYLTTSGPITIRHPQVISHLEAPSLESAQLCVNVELQNTSLGPVKGVLKGRIADIQFEQPIELDAMQSRRVAFTPEQFPQLKISHPRVWWPWQMGAQELYELTLEVGCTGQISDRYSVRFGIREVTSELNAHGDRLFKVNGKRLLIRGALWWPDLLLRSSPAKQEAEIRYVRDMNLNTLRMDGRFEDEQFLNLIDQAGIMLMPGWPCCDHWEKWNEWKEEDYRVATEMLRDQIRRFRNHPSVLTWLNGDDNPPVPNVEKAYIRVLEEENWPSPYQSSSGGKPSAVTGRSGYKGTLNGHYGPYNYVPPNYWSLDHERGGAWGFNTETSPGPTIPPKESLLEFLPADKLWPINEYWSVHSDQSPERHELQVHLAALNARYGPAADVDDFTEKSQIMSYEGERAMYEAYSKNKYIATGIIHHDLNNPWPSMVFHLYDSYLRPGGAYFGVKKACEPVHIQYSYDDRSVVVVNSTYREVKNLRAKVEVYNLDLIQKFAKEAVVNVAEDGVSKVLIIPGLAGLTATYFVRLALQNAAGLEISSNFYWLSTRPDVLDWKHSREYTPTLSYSDLTRLSKLPPVKLNARYRTKQEEDECLTTVRLQNPTKHLAFFLHLSIREGSKGGEVLPIFWKDNYFSLMPGEKRQITAKYRKTDLHGATPVVEVDGWNVPRVALQKDETLLD